MSGPPRRDVTGQRFGRLVAVRDVGRDKRHNRLWLFRCDCGGETTIPVGRAVCGNTSSCGCLYRESVAPHGDSSSGRNAPEYRAWAHMRRRCTNPKHPQFHDYGGRGIAICERWSDYRNFLADMGRRPSPKHSIDRIDVDGNYEPGNCRWTTKDVQQHNQRARSNTGHRGISWSARDKSYTWCVTRRGKRIAGSTRSLTEAIAKRDAAKAQLYGDTP